MSVSVSAATNVITNPACLPVCINSLSDTSPSQGNAIVTSDTLQTLCDAAFNDMNPLMECLASTCETKDLGTIATNKYKSGAVLGPYCLSLTGKSSDSEWKPNPAPVPTDLNGFSNAIGPNATSADLNATTGHRTSVYEYILGQPSCFTDCLNGSSKSEVGERTIVQLCSYALKHQRIDNFWSCLDSLCTMDGANYTVMRVGDIQRLSEQCGQDLQQYQTGLVSQQDTNNIYGSAQNQVFKYANIESIPSGEIKEFFSKHHLKALFIIMFVI
ncbi:hypothetical protein BC830DRAFT_1221004 [Chytriomyces sp. MP71]|nr:hypothetical protein BC830DRAFT_1221004 [Chytriomyces sp. MP71]